VAGALAEVVLVILWSAFCVRENANQRSGLQSRHPCSKELVELPMPNEEAFSETLGAEDSRKTGQSAPTVETFSLPCPECERLERACRDAIKQIKCVVANRFKDVAAKLRELRRWQDARDRANVAFYEHKKRSHSRKKAA